MKRQGNWRALISATLVLSFVSGCGSVTMSAANSVNPVLFGPVKAIGGKPAAKKAEVIDYKLNDFLYLSLIYDQASTGSMKDVGTTSPQYVTDTKSSQTIDNPVKMDVKVVSATNGDMNRLVELARIECQGFSFYGVFAIREMIECKVQGLSPRHP